MASCACRKLADMRLIYDADNCNRWKVVQMYRQLYTARRVPGKLLYATLHGWLWETGFWDVYTTDVGGQWKTRTAAAEEFFFQKSKVMIPQVHELLPKTPHLEICTWRKPEYLSCATCGGFIPGDYTKRVELASWYLKESAADWNFEAGAIFTDEASFS